MKKSGLSLMSMVIYVALFFAFMTFATIIATNMNYTSLAAKGKVVNEENLQKLQFNILNSAKNSVSIDNISSNIVFSNDDEYVYYSSKKAVLKNGTKLVTDIVSFEVVSIENLTNVPTSFFEKQNGEYVNLDSSKDYICINVSLKKYGVETNSQIFVVAGDENIE